jgi:DNA-directed RNA polymerase subunit M/transcription elongation factor TFIIS
MIPKADGRYHCSQCGYSTQLANKYARHLLKKHPAIKTVKTPRRKAAVRLANNQKENDK